MLHYFAAAVTHTHTHNKIFNIYFIIIIKMCNEIWIILSAIYMWSVKNYNSILEQGCKHKFQVLQLLIKVRGMTKLLL
jgi:hypothetical protein